MTHAEEIAMKQLDNDEHMAAHGTLCRAAMGWSVETMRRAVEWGQMQERRAAHRKEWPVRFDQSGERAEARAQAVRDAWARQKGELRHDPEAQA